MSEKKTKLKQFMTQRFPLNHTQLFLLNLCLKQRKQQLQNCLPFKLKFLPDRRINIFMVMLRSLNL